jgi:outer membrane protein
VNPIFAAKLSMRMKSFSLILNLILVIAVIILFYLHFSERPKSVEAAVNLPSAVNGNIVYVNSDSLLDQYDYFKTKKSEFDQAQNKIKGQLRSEGEKLQKEIEEYQKNASMMTSQQRQATEEQLAAKQQNFLQKKDEMMGKLDSDQSKVNDEIYTKLGSYMKEFNKKRNYSYILGYQRGGGILFANDSLNITKEIISGLNQEYQEEQKGKK